MLGAKAKGGEAPGPLSLLAPRRARPGPPGGGGRKRPRPTPDPAQGSVVETGQEAATRRHIREAGRRKARSDARTRDVHALERLPCFQEGA